MGKMKFLYDPVHRQNFYFFRGTSPKSVISQVKKHFKIDISECGFDAHGLTIELQHPSGAIIIWLKSKNDFGTFVHEVMHACAFALTYRGYEFTKNQEAFSYLAGFLTREFWKTK